MSFVATVGFIQQNLYSFTKKSHFTDFLLFTMRLRHNVLPNQNVLTTRVDSQRSVLTSLAKPDRIHRRTTLGVKKLAWRNMHDWLTLRCCHLASDSRILIHPPLSLQGPSKLHSSFHFGRASKWLYLWKSHPKPLMSHNHNSPPLYLPLSEATYVLHDRFVSEGKSSDRSTPFLRHHPSSCKGLANT